jgi:hypothetical protein
MARSSHGAARVTPSSRVRAHTPPAGEPKPAAKAMTEVWARRTSVEVPAPKNPSYKRRMQMFPKGTYCVRL